MQDQQIVVASEPVIQAALDAAFRVHREMGPGLLESVYEAAMAIELAENGLRVETQVPVRARYRGHDLGIGFRADMVVEGSLLLELKAVEVVPDLALAQTMNYLRLLELKHGYILNSNRKLMKDGIRRVSI